jgi:4-oxalocrotonate tautomerase
LRYGTKATGSLLQERDQMPVVQVHLKAGRTVEQKRQLVERITDSLVEIAGANRERVHVIIDEVPGDNWGRAGRLLSDD